MATCNAWLEKCYRDFLNPHDVPVRITHHVADWPSDLISEKSWKPWYLSGRLFRGWAIKSPETSGAIAEIARQRREHAGMLERLLGGKNYVLYIHGAEVARIEMHFGSNHLYVGGNRLADFGWFQHRYASDGISWKFEVIANRGCTVRADSSQNLMAAIMCAVVIWDEVFYDS